MHLQIQKEWYQSYSHVFYRIQNLFDLIINLIKKEKSPLFRWISFQNKGGSGNMQPNRTELPLSSML